MSFNTNTNQHSVVNFNYFDMGDSSPEKVAKLVKLLSSQPVSEQEPVKTQIKDEPKIKVEPKVEPEQEFDSKDSDIQIVEIPKSEIEVIEVSDSDKEEEKHKVDTMKKHDDGQLIEIKPKLSLRNGNCEQMNIQEPIKLRQNWKNITGDEEILPYLGNDMSDLGGTGYGGQLGYAFIDNNEDDVKLTDQFRKIPKFSDIDEKYHFMRETGQLGIFTSSESEFLKKLVDIEGKLNTIDDVKAKPWGGDIIDLIVKIKDKMGYNKEAVEKVREFINEMKKDNLNFNNNEPFSEKNLNTYMKKYLNNETGYVSSPVKDVLKKVDLYSVKTPPSNNNKEEIKSHPLIVNFIRDKNDVPVPEKEYLNKQSTPINSLSDVSDDEIQETNTMLNKLIEDAIKTDDKDDKEEVEEVEVEDVWVNVKDFYSDSVKYGLNIKYYTAQEMKILDKCVDEIKAMESNSNMMIDEDIVNGEVSFNIKKKNAKILSVYRKDSFDILERIKKNVSLSNFTHLFNDEVSVKYFDNKYNNEDLNKLKGQIYKAIYMLGMNNIHKIKIGESATGGWKSTTIFEIKTIEGERFSKYIGDFNLDDFTCNLFSNEVYEIIQSNKYDRLNAANNSEDRYRIGVVLKGFINSNQIYSKKICIDCEYFGSNLYKIA